MKEATAAQLVPEFRSALASQLGLAFDESRGAELEGIIESRLRARRSDIATYRDELLAGFDQEELEALSPLVTVAETFFFRHEHQLQVGLARIVELAQARPEQRPCRILSMGCASGEEPYSLSILLHERWPELVSWFELCAVDINRTVIERARLAKYGAWSLRSTPPDLATRWFRPEGKCFRVVPTIKNHVRFSIGNLASDDSSTLPPAHYDAIFCRNVLMYFSPGQFQSAVLRLSKALKPQGYLFLGHAETLRGVDSDFELRNEQSAFFYQLGNGAGHAPSWVPGPEQRRSAPTTSDTWMGEIARSTARVESLHTETSATDQPEPPGLSALALLHEERFEQALDQLRATAAFRSGDLDQRLVEAVLLVHQNELEQAEAFARRLLPSLLEPRANSGVNYILALCAEARSDLHAALAHNEAAITVDPTFSLAQLQLGRLLRRLGEPDRAATELRHAKHLLQHDDTERLSLFGAGLGRASLLAYCDAELMQTGRQS